MSMSTRLPHRSVAPRRSPASTAVLLALLATEAAGCSSGAATGHGSGGASGTASGGTIGTIGTGGTGTTGDRAETGGQTETTSTSAGGAVGAPSPTDAGAAGDATSEPDMHPAGNDGNDAGAAPDGSGGPFSPCPSTGANCAVMPLGDSITEGTGSSGGGYRVELFRLSATNAKHLTFVGRSSNGPDTVAGQPFPKNHEGYPHYTIDDETAFGRMGISPLVDQGLSLGKPNIILLMIGTNDVNNAIDLATAPTRLGALLDRMTTDAPNALIVVAQIVPTANDTTNLDVVAYNNAIPALVQARTASGKHLLMVDMYAAMNANPSYKTALMHDGLHPNDAGYVVMGQTWYGAIKSYLH